MSQVIVPVASTYTTPSDYNDTGAVWEAIGAGGNGGNGTTNTSGGGGGGGGEYQKVITPGLAANTIYDINIPSGGAGSGVSGTYIKNGAGGGGTIVLEAKNGGNGATPTAGTAGTGGTPNTAGQHFNGGAGGTGGGINRSGAGGGGSAGNIGVGKDGGTGVAVTTGGGGGGGSNGGSSTAGGTNTTLGSDGGAGTGGTGGGTGATSSADATAASAGGGGGSGMATNNHLGSAGAVDTSFDATHGASGGGGSGTRNTGTSGNGRAGGTYGGGGGGAGDSTTTGGTGGTGGAGILVFNYTPVATGIAHDADSNSTYQAASSSYSWSHTCTGSNRYLIVGVSMLSLAQTVTGITYNSVAMTLLGTRNSISGAARVEVWGLVAPSTGSNTIAVTLSGSIASAGVASSYTGVHQTSPTEGFNSAQATNVGAADATVNITTVADNDWVIDVVATDDTAITIGAGNTSRNNVTGAGGSGANADNNAAKTPAGSVTMSWTDIGALATWVIAGIALRPIAAADLSTVGIQTLLLMGLGT